MVRFRCACRAVYVVRRSHMTSEATYSTMRPALCIVAQGAKVVMVGRDVLEYDPAHVLVLAVDLPISSQVIRASQLRQERRPERRRSPKVATSRRRQGPNL